MTRVDVLFGTRRVSRMLADGDDRLVSIRAVLAAIEALADRAEDAGR